MSADTDKFDKFAETVMECGLLFDSCYNKFKSKNNALIVRTDGPVEFIYHFYKNFFEKFLRNLLSKIFIGKIMF